MEITYRQLQRQAFDSTVMGKLGKCIELAILGGLIAFLMLKFMISNTVPNPDQHTLDSVMKLQKIIIIAMTVVGFIMGFINPANSLVISRLFQPSAHAIEKYKKKRKEILERYIDETKEGIETRKQNIQNYQKEILLLDTM